MAIDLNEMKKLAGIPLDEGENLTKKIQNAIKKRTEIVKRCGPEARRLMKKAGVKGSETYMHALQAVDYMHSQPKAQQSAMRDGIVDFLKELGSRGE